MGNKETVEDHSIQIHDKFGQVKIEEAIDPITKERYETMQLTKTIQENQLNAWLKQISKIDDSQTRQVLIIPLKHTFTKQGMCGSIGTLTLIYEKYPLILENQIANRLQLNKFFIESEMWYILFNMIRAANKFERFQSKIGDVHPSNILINEDGQIKLISRLSMPDQLTNFDKLVEDSTANVYLAPQQFNEKYISKGQYPNVDQSKAQVYSIGITLLSCGTLQNCDKIYEKKSQYKINKEKLKQLMDNFNQRYGVFLVQTVFGMLVQEPINRKKSSQIYQTLLPYQNQILQLQPFNVKLKQSAASSYQPIYSYGQTLPNKNQNYVYRAPSYTRNEPFQNQMRFTYGKH